MGGVVRRAAERHIVANLAGAGSRRDEAALSNLSRLLEDVAQGDRAAFRSLYDLQSSRLYAVALRITRQSALASDAVHDAFLQVWRNAARFDASRGNAESWMVSLVRYRALDIARRRGREVSDEGIPEQIDPEPDALQQLARGREARALHDCLAGLTEERRRLIVLAFVDGLSHSELAERVRLPLGTVKSWIRRGLQALRGCLEAK